MELLCLPSKYLICASKLFFKQSTLQKSFHFILGFALFIGYHSSLAQEPVFFGARYEAMARSGIAVQDAWSMFYNPAGMPFNQMQLMAAYQSKYVSLGINDGAFGFSFPISQTALGVGVSYFGDQLLSKTKAVASVAHRLGKTTLGLKTTYDQLRVPEVGTQGIFYVDVGGQIDIGEQFTVGMALANLNLAKFDTLTGSQPASQVQIGINYHPHEKLILTASVEKDIAHPAVVRAGFEYALSPYARVRTGIVPKPTAGYVGVGLSWLQMQLNLTGAYQQNLGWSGGFSIGVPLTNSHEK